MKINICNKRIVMAMLIAMMPFQIIYAQYSIGTGNKRVASVTRETGSSRFLNQLRNDQKFEENKGQITGQDAKSVKYLYRANEGLAIFFRNGGISYQFEKIHYPKDYEHRQQYKSQTERTHLREQIRRETYRMDVNLIGCNLNAAVLTEERSVDYKNYYNHNALDVHDFGKITYQNIYPGIDWVIYQSEGKLKYDFVVKPGGNLLDIRLELAFVENTLLNPNGSLTLKNRMGTITEQAPTSFQGNTRIPTSFKINGNIISFELASFDPLKTLIIDPALDWSTYYGGTGREHGSSCAVDRSGAIYLAGWTESFGNIASGGHQDVMLYSTSDLLVKFDSTGVRQWATYYAGNGGELDVTCATDSKGCVYLAGTTSVVASVASGGHQNVHKGNWDAYLAKFNSDGSRQWATYYGDSNYDFGNGCAVDGDDFVILSGITSSLTGIASGGHQNTFAGEYDAYVVKFDSLGVRQWGTYYGGNSNEYGTVCAANASGDIYLTGTTLSNNNISFMGHQPLHHGGDEAFLVKFNKNGVRQWGTYYGGSGGEAGWSVACENTGAVYLSGRTTSTNHIAFNGFKNYKSGWEDAFLVKFDKDGDRQWSTYYGGSGDNPLSFDRATVCRVTSTGGVFIAGYTPSLDSISTPDGYQTAYGGGHSDAYIAKFNSNTGTREWASYFGGGGVEYCYGLAADENTGTVYLGGHSNSLSNIASGGYQNTNSGSYDNFLARLKDPCVTDTLDPFISIAMTPVGSIAAGETIEFRAVIDNEGLFPDLQWYKNGSLIENAHGVYWSGVMGTDFQGGDLINVLLRSNAACLRSDTAWSNTLTLAQLVGIANNKLPAGFHIYPNPTDGQVYIDGLQKGDLIEIVNVVGQLVKRYLIGNSDKLSTTLDGYAPGIYLYRFKRGGEVTWDVKVIKR